jgi:hypothetical protein
MLKPMNTILSAAVRACSASRYSNCGSHMVELPSGRGLPLGSWRNWAEKLYSALYVLGGIMNLS